jgi:hypothetical protein
MLVDKETLDVAKFVIASSYGIGHTALAFWSLKRGAQYEWKVSWVMVIVIASIFMLSYSSDEMKWISLTFFAAGVAAELLNAYRCTRVRLENLQNNSL